MNKKESIVISITTHNNLTTRRKGLDDCLESLQRAINKFHFCYNIPITISYVDDASEDDTYNYVSEKIGTFKLVQPDKVSINFTSLESNQHQSFARNLAVSRTNCSLICFLDSDDEYLGDHLIKCYEEINKQDASGRYPALITTQAQFDKELRVHQEWKPRISGTIPITKMIRREAWDFIEGFPTGEIYKRTGCEDQDFILLFQNFFHLKAINEETVKYNWYKDSFFDKQLKKFQSPVSEAKPTLEEERMKPLAEGRQGLIQGKLHYLKTKYTYYIDVSKLENLSLIGA